MLASQAILSELISLQLRAREVNRIAKDSLLQNMTAVTIFFSNKICMYTYILYINTICCCSCVNINAL